MWLLLIHLEDVRATSAMIGNKRLKEPNQLTVSKYHILFSDYPLTTWQSHQQEFLPIFSAVSDQLPTQILLGYS